MCGRFNVSEMPGLKALLDYLGIDLQLPPPRYNLAPTEDVLLLHDWQGELARWWLTPSWAKEVNTNSMLAPSR